jgi:hypothetical protein
MNPPSPPARFHELIDLFDAWHHAHAHWREAVDPAEQASLCQVLEEMAQKFRALAGRLADSSGQA